MAQAEGPAAVPRLPQHAVLGEDWGYAARDWKARIVGPSIQTEREPGALVIPVVGIALLLVIAGLLMLIWGRRMRKKCGLPSGAIVYDDSGAREELEQPLISRRHALVGRPDYVVRRVENGKQVVLPVEVKSGRAPAQPHPGHALQVAAYCLLIEEHYGITPAYGLIRYADGMRGVPFDAAARRSVLEAADAIRRARRAPDMPRSHNQPERCRRCGYRAACGQTLESAS